MALRKNLSLSLRFLMTLGVPWLLDVQLQSLPPSSDGLHFYLSASSLLSLKFVIGFRACHWIQIIQDNLILRPLTSLTSTEILFPNKVTFTGSGLEYRLYFWGNPQINSLLTLTSCVALECYYYLIIKSCLTLLQSHRLQPTRLLCPWNSTGENTGVGNHFLLQRIFLTQRLNPCLLHWQVDSLLLSCSGQLSTKKSSVRFLIYEMRSVLTIVLIFSGSLLECSIPRQNRTVKGYIIKCVF